MRAAGLVAGVLTLAGCSGNVGYVLNTYAGTQPVSFTAPSGDWRAFDQPANNRMMITPSLGAAARYGSESAGPGSAFQATGEPERFQAAADHYLVSTGRAHCRTAPARFLITTQYEITYDCSRGRT
jgi:hypothetical protein